MVLQKTDSFDSYAEEQEWSPEEESSSPREGVMGTPSTTVKLSFYHSSVVNRKTCLIMRHTVEWYVKNRDVTPTRSDRVYTKIGLRLRPT